MPKGKVRDLKAKHKCWCGRRFKGAMALRKHQQDCTVPSWTENHNG